ncbi:Disease resistance RPP13-like protein 4 [Camellia lanceoleosa]|uniref:Disease resistance RPP13-like protein 4 n=1 Tax=Camellia lanceoleosa TaxID=1840588 RepID=A0ACC0FWN3_9ERIC|nr:Disease resistance RPP13-like protein 4 [Camellia lanceoleosa]
MDSSISQPNPLNNHHHKATTAPNNNDDYQVADPDLTNMIGRDLNFMKETMTEIQKFVDRMNVQINQACEKFEEIKTRGGSNTNELDQLKMSVKKLKSQIPSKLKIRYDDDSKPHRKPWFDASINSSSSNYQVDVNKAGYLHSLYKEPKFDHASALADIQVSFHSLPPEQKIILDFFRIFPEMATIKKRFMIYWLIGEGVLFREPADRDERLANEIFDELAAKGRLPPRQTAEDFVNKILHELTAKGFIEPIYKNCGFVVDSYRMPPYIRSAVTLELEGHDFDYFPNLRFACWERCIVNVDAAIIDGRHEIIFRRGTNLKVVYLGRWQNSVTHHIEVSDIKILNFLKNMKQLRFLSLRGISLITELPQYISQLTDLKILDLKACHNLEVVPDWIGLLENLTHFDISECYLLDHMPKGLGALSNLQVLKGFIVGDFKDKKSCTIYNLAKLSKLRKLSISISMKEFPIGRQLHHLQRLKFLQKLKISWSGCILRGKTDDSPKQAQLFSKQTTLTRSFIELRDPTLPHFLKDPTLPVLLELPSSLQKLELEGFPEIDTPIWLRYGNLKNLKKLYIRGGLLCNLDEIVAPTVEMLQLKYLSNLEMSWNDIMMLFPNLIHLEKVECPGLNSFPCDGVWKERQ